MNPRQRLSYLIAISSVVSGMGLSAQAQIEIAEDLLVNVDATVEPEGTLNSIVNNGTLGGLFEARGGGTTVPVIALEGGTKGIRFDGGDFMQLADMVGGTLIVPPAGIVGAARTASIEVWAFNDNVLNEETILSWGRRGGPDGSNMSFNYGWDTRWGAVGHWGNPDLGWINAGGNPAAGKWHHLVYTYDGTTTRVYSDGALMNQEVVALNTHANTSIQLAAQLDANGTTVTAGLRGSLSLGRVRIHDGVLSDAQVLANYNTERAAFVDPVTAPAILASPPVHRWSFNEAATANATDLTFADSVGGADGTVRGAGAQFTGTRLSLVGGASATQAYGDLPNGLLSVNSTNNGGTGAVTLEGWIRVTGGRSWARILDIGSTTTGEITGPGGTGGGSDYLFYTAQVGTDTAIHRLELRDNEDAAGNQVVTRDLGAFATLNTDRHIVITWDEASGVISAYENGAFQGSIAVDDAMSDINDVNVWLGRSNFTADQNMQGEFDEFRIYPRVLSTGEILGNFQAGPNTLNTGETPVSIVENPASATGLVGFPTAFSVSVAGTPPVALQWQRNGMAIPGANSATYSLVAAAEDDGAVFSLVASNFAGGSPRVVTSTPATFTVRTSETTLRHRYMFDEAAPAAALAGVVGGPLAHDFLGGAHGTVVGGGTFGGGRLTLDGVTGYVNLPNDLVTNFQSITIEAWVQDDGSGGWARIFDFGNSTAGEDFPAPTGGAAGTQYMFLAFPSGFGNLRGAYTVGGGGAAEQLIEWLGNRPTAGQLVHVVWISRGPSQTGRLYVDGTLVGSNPGVTLTPASLGPTVNNWLGRAQFNDPFFRGQYEEFRIWDGAMTPAQVAASLAAGPNADVGGGVRLRITRETGGRVKLSWPLEATDYVLECSSVLGPDAAWDLVFETVVEENGFFTVTVDASLAAKFYRLSR
jgi:hypothetical protein